MDSASDVIENKPFASYPEILLFVVSVLLVAVILYPKKMLYRQITNNEKIEPVALFYLNQIIVSDSSNSNLQIALIKQNIGSAHWQAAEQQLQVLTANPNASISKSEILWLQYLLALKKIYYLPDDSPEQKAEITRAQSLLEPLLAEKFKPQRLEELANDALALGLPKLALTFYLKLNQEVPIQDINLLERVGRVALYSSEYKTSAYFYFLAAKKSKNIYRKRSLLIEGLKACLAGGIAEEGLKEIDDFPPELINNRKMLLYLANYAISANRPDLAEKYVQRALMAK